MRKKYVYAITLILLSIILWTGYYLYVEFKPVVYENGTFVEVPEVNAEEALELMA